MIEFALPWALLLAPLPLAVWIFARPMPQKRAVEAPESVIAHLRRHAVASPDRRSGATDLALKLIIWAAILMALAGPYSRLPDLLTPTGRDVIVAIDLSASMAEEDMIVAGAATRRIEIIRDRMARFLDNRTGDRIALIGFAEEAYLIAPFTHDAKAVAEMLHEAPIGLPGRKTDLGRAIGLAVRLARDEPAGERLLILISDGEANAGDLAARDAAAMARDLGLKLFAIGFAEQLETANAAHMADLAATTGGAFISAGDPGAMDAAMRAVDETAGDVHADAGAERRRDLTWPFAGLALLCLAALMWREAGEA